MLYVIVVDELYLMAIKKRLMNISKNITNKDIYNKNFVFMTREDVYVKRNRSRKNCERKEHPQ